MNKLVKIKFFFGIKFYEAKMFVLCVLFFVVFLVFRIGFGSSRCLVVGMVFFRGSWVCFKFFLLERDIYRGCIFVFRVLGFLENIFFLGKEKGL